MSLLDPKWKYVPAAETNIRETFKRARKEIEAEAQRRKANESKVTELHTVKKGQPK